MIPSHVKLTDLLQYFLVRKLLRGFQGKQWACRVQVHIDVKRLCC